jgi:uncharacterized membrane protein YhaH (DUF805 family)
MSPLDWMKMPLTRYADFNGRSRRMEYWMFVVGIIVAMIVTTVIDGVLGMTGMVFGVYGPLTTLLLLGVFIPSIACAVRRFHDQDKTGWLVLMAFIPLVNLVFLVFMFLEGTKGDNQYGPDPKAGAAA